MALLGKFQKDPSNVYSKKYNKDGLKTTIRLQENIEYEVQKTNDKINAYYKVYSIIKIVS